MVHKNNGDSCWQYISFLLLLRSNTNFVFGYKSSYTGLTHFASCIWWMVNSNVNISNIYTCTYRLFIPSVLGQKHGGWQLDRIEKLALKPTGCCTARLLKHWSHVPPAPIRRKVSWWEGVKNRYFSLSLFFSTVVRRRYTPPPPPRAATIALLSYSETCL